VRAAEVTIEQGDMTVADCGSHFLHRQECFDEQALGAAESSGREMRTKCPSCAPMHQAAEMPWREIQFARDAFEPERRVHMAGRDRGQRVRYSRIHNHLYTETVAILLYTPLSGTMSVPMRVAGDHCVNAIVAPMVCTATTSATHAGQPPARQTIDGSADPTLPPT
jgi:hypothetical protein